MKFFKSLSCLCHCSFLIFFLFSSCPISALEKSNEIRRRQIFSEGSFAPGYHVGIDTYPDHLTNWLYPSADEDALCMDYPAGQKWGAVFITLEPPKRYPDYSVDYSGYAGFSDFSDFSGFTHIALEVRGENGGESVMFGVKDFDDPPDGSETKMLLKSIPKHWQKISIPLTKIETLDYKYPDEKLKLYVVSQFVFKDNPGTVCFRNIEYYQDSLFQESNEQSTISENIQHKSQNLIDISIAPPERICRKDRLPTQPRLCIDPPGIEIGAKYDDLDNGFDDWYEAYLTGEAWIQPDRTVAFGRFRETNRFDLFDEELLVGAFSLLDDYKRWGLTVQGTFSPAPQALPEWSVNGRIKHALSRDLRAEAGYKYTEYTGAKVNQESVRVEYGNTFQLANTLEFTQVEGAGSGFINIAEATYYYQSLKRRPSSSRVGLKFLVGDIVERQPTFVLRNNVWAAILEGQHFFSRRWGLTYSAQFWNYGEQYDRLGVGLGVRYRY